MKEYELVANIIGHVFVMTQQAGYFYYLTPTFDIRRLIALQFSLQDKPGVTNPMKATDAQSGRFLRQNEKYTHRRNVILGIIKAHFNVVKTRPANVNCGKINA